MNKMSNWRDPTREDLGPQESTRGSISQRELSRKQSSGRRGSSSNSTPTLLLAALILLNIFLSSYLVIRLFTIGEKLDFLQQQLHQSQQGLYPSGGR